VWLNSYPRHCSVAFAFSIIPSPQIHQRPLRLAFPCGRPMGLPRSAQVTIMSDLGPTYTPEVQRSRQGNRYTLVLTLSCPGTYHFGPGVSHDLAVSSILRLFYVTTLAVVHICWPYHPTLAPSPPDTGSWHFHSRFCAHPYGCRVHCSRGFAPHWHSAEWFSQ